MIMDSIKEDLPKNAMISDVSYEGSEIILYTKNKEFFNDSTDLIKKIVNKVKKRIEVRADQSIVMNEEKTIELIKKLVPDEAGVKDIYFEPEFAKVVIHAEKPGLVIGKSGETLLSIKQKTFWTPQIYRAPVIDSELIKSIRKMLHKDAGYRKKFLNKIGEKIYAEGKEVEWIRLTGLGSFREVGRSCMLLQTPQTRVLLDCGMAVNLTATKPYPYLDASEFNIQTLDAVLLSHAHMDHIGMVPYLYEYGYRGPVYCTRPTRDIAALMQLDYIQICQRENRKAFYSSKSIEEAIRHCIPLEYGEVTDIAPDMRITFQNAGHLLGSSSIHIHIGDGLYNLVYSGDIKYENTKLFEKAYTDYTRAEAIIIESTYGNSEGSKPSHKDGEASLIQHVRTALERGGRVLIPSFAVGRSQDVITILTETDINVPIYLDGMIWDTTAIHTAYPEYMSKYIQTLILHKGKNPFTDSRLHGIGSQKEREVALNSTEPAIIISTSGMLMGGPAIEYLQAMAGNEKNMILFVGYQAEGSPGRRIQKGWKEVQLDNGKTLELKLDVQTVSGLGGHSDQPQLLAYLQHFKNKPRKIIVNHGDGTGAVEFARTIHKLFRVESVAPRNLETIRLR
ncbi:MAG TPA: beta-CASP ribonuclease aCPSF1 [Candidatus Aenigmarchaeota archaeon]|nr:beta-CASP ribonuclease aCPSF1 [Candidatus Aenigmarchaeota archaeon]